MAHVSREGNIFVCVCGNKQDIGQAIDGRCSRCNQLLEPSVQSPLVKAVMVASNGDAERGLVLGMKICEQQGVMELRQKETDAAPVSVPQVRCRNCKRQQPIVDGNGDAVRMCVHCKSRFSRKDFQRIVASAQGYREKVQNRVAAVDKAEAMDEKSCPSCNLPANQLKDEDGSRLVNCPRCGSDLSLQEKRPLAEVVRSNTGLELPPVATDVGLPAGEDSAQAVGTPAAADNPFEQEADVDLLIDTSEMEMVSAEKLRSATLATEARILAEAEEKARGIMSHAETRAQELIAAAEEAQLKRDAAEEDAVKLNERKDELDRLVADLVKQAEDTLMYVFRHIDDITNPDFDEAKARLESLCKAINDVGTKRLELSDLHDYILGKRAELKELQDKVDARRKQHEEESKRLREEQAVCADAEKENAAADRRIKRLNGRYDELAAQIDRIQDRLNNAIIKLAELREELEKKKSLESEIKSHIDRLTEKKEQLLGQSQQTNDSRAAVEEEIAQIKARIQALRDELPEKEKELASAFADFQKALEQYEQAAFQRLSIISEKEEVQKKSSELQSQLDVVGARTSSLNARISELRKELDGLDKQIQALTANKESLDKSFAEADSVFQQTRQSVTDLRSAVEDKKREAAELTARIPELKEKLVRAKAETMALRKEQSGLRAEAARASAEKQKADMETRKLESAIEKEKQREHKPLNIAVWVTAISAIGVSAGAIGGIAWLIYYIVNS